MQNPRNSLAHVYVIENSLGVVNVGIATNPAKRFKAITASSGLPIVQSHLSPLCLNYLAVEKALLAYFKDFRVQGEWLQGIDYKTVCSALDSHFSSLPATVESQSNSPVIFDFENNQLRTINKGETVWFVAKDVCDALDIANVSDAVSRLDDDEKLLSLLPIAGQNRETLCINESGLYALILRSNKPQAKPFRKWITSDVIPSIRKTGGYGNHDLITQVYELQRQVSAIQSLIPTNLINSTQGNTGAYELRFSRDVENLKRFYQECTTNDMNAYLPIGIIGFSRTTHLYPAYVVWCERECVRGVSLNNFARISIRALKCLGWQGIYHERFKNTKVIQSVLAQFVSDTCVNRTGTSLIIGSSNYAYSHEKGLYRAYLTWCNNSDFFPVPLETFQEKIVIVITDYLQWKNIYTRKTHTGEHKIFGVAYKHVGAANHG